MKLGCAFCPASFMSAWEKLIIKGYICMKIIVYDIYSKNVRVLPEE